MEYGDAPQTISAKAHDDSAVTLSATNIGDKCTFDTKTGLMSYVKAVDTKTTITITATNVTNSQDSNSINIDLLPINTPIDEKVEMFCYAQQKGSDEWNAAYFLFVPIADEEQNISYHILCDNDGKYIKFKDTNGNEIEESFNITSVTIDGNKENTTDEKWVIEDDEYYGYVTEDSDHIINLDENIQIKSEWYRFETDTGHFFYAIGSEGKK